MLPTDEIQAGDLRMEGYSFRVLLVVVALALTLSRAGIYAVTSFTVARRTREIGVRVALGADPRCVAASIRGRPLAQVGLGAVLAYGATLFAVCLLACVVPTRRALAIQPTEALRSDG